jgi:hypothetical protein
MWGIRYPRIEFMFGDLSKDIKSRCHRHGGYSGGSLERSGLEVSK